MIRKVPDTQGHQGFCISTVGPVEVPMRLPPKPLRVSYFWVAGNERAEKTFIKGYNKGLELRVVETTILGYIGTTTTTTIRTHSFIPSLPVRFQDDEIATLFCQKGLDIPAWASETLKVPSALAQ